MAAFRTTWWKRISGILAILCVLLTTLLGILLNKYYLNQSIKPTISPGSTVEYQEGYSSCCSCPEGWIGYQCTCYFLSNEQKSWEASRKFCESKNSSLLQLHSKDELDFLRNNLKFSWLGASYSKDHGTWLWLNGSAVSLNLFKELQYVSMKNCTIFTPNGGVLAEFCWENISYICKQELS